MAEVQADFRVVKRQEMAQPWDLLDASTHPKNTKREHKKALGS